MTTTTIYDGALINDRVCGCDEATIDLTNAEVDQMVESIVTGGTWDTEDEPMTDDEIRADVRATIESCRM